VSGVFEVGPGAAARGFCHASGETIGHEVGELIDGEESGFGDLVAIEVEAVEVGLIEGATAEDDEEFVALGRVRRPILYEGCGSMICGLPRSCCGFGPRCR
jgi:hypothetical protein